MYRCCFCNRIINSKSGLTNHQNRCKNNPNRIPASDKLSETGGNCQFCHKHCKNHNSLRNHERLCKENPNRQFTNMHSTAWQEEMRSRIDYTNSWIKGKTKESSDSIRKGIEKRKQTIAKLKAEGNYRKDGKANTAEAEELRRKRISETMKKNPKAGGKRAKSGRGKKGWYKGYFCDSTYELVFIIYNLDHNIEFKRCELEYTYTYNGEIHKYYPDFELGDGSLVETKGYHTQLVDIKLSAVTDRQITILYEKDLKYAFDWVKDHYTYKQLSDLYE